MSACTVSGIARARLKRPVKAKPLEKTEKRPERREPRRQGELTDE